jgi:hypothetical protein
MRRISDPRKRTAAKPDPPAVEREEAEAAEVVVVTVAARRMEAGRLALARRDRIRRLVDSIKERLRSSLRDQSLYPFLRKIGSAIRRRLPKKSSHAGPASDRRRTLGQRGAIGAGWSMTVPDEAVGAQLGGGVIDLSEVRGGAAELDEHFRESSDGAHT